jgi:hypothetical protein
MQCRSNLQYLLIAAIFLLCNFFTSGQVEAQSCLDVNFQCTNGTICMSDGGCAVSGQIYCGGSISCDSNSKCSIYGQGCIGIDVVECSGGGTCSEGSQCGSGNQCVPFGSQDCGNGISCELGKQCGSNRSCVDDGANDCGNGSSCAKGLKCALDGIHCLPIRDNDCGQYSCSFGKLCSSAGRCIANTEIDCGGGTICSQGELCGTTGKCLVYSEPRQQPQTPLPSFPTITLPTIDVGTSWIVHGVIFGLMGFIFSILRKSDSRLLQVSGYLGSSVAASFLAYAFGGPLSIAIPIASVFGLAIGLVLTADS